MKKVFVLLLLISASYYTQSQNEGKIVFEEKTKLEIELPPEMEQFKDKFPSENVATKELTYNNAASIYKNEEKSDDAEEIEMGGEGMQINIKFAQPYEELYHDHASGEILHQQEFMTRTFLIEKQSKHLAWKMEMEQKEILGYMCQKATFTDTSRTIEAWFTPQIAISGGPGGFGGLPGLILEVNLSEPEMSIVATSIELGLEDDSAIKKPKKGKKVSEEEYTKIVEEKTKEMQAENGGNRVIIRH